MTEHPSPLVEMLAQMNASTYGYDTNDEHEMDDLRAEAHDILEALGWPGRDGYVPVWMKPSAIDNALYGRDPDEDYWEPLAAAEHLAVDLEGWAAGAVQGDQEGKR